MRAIKTVITASGNLEGDNPSEVEMTAEDGKFKEDEFVVQVLAFTI